MRRVLTPVLSLVLAAGMLAGCGSQGMRPVAATTSVSSVKAMAAQAKLSRRQAETKAKGLIEEFNQHRWRSINARSEAIQKIAKTEADAAFEFLLQEVDDLQELRNEMKSVTVAEQEEYEELLLEQIDALTPDQAEAKARKQRAESLGRDLDELTIEDMGGAAMAARMGGGPSVGTKNRVVSAIQESKIYKVVKKAYKNTRRTVKRFFSSLWKKMGFR